LEGVEVDMAEVKVQKKTTPQMPQTVVVAEAVEVTEVIRIKVVMVATATHGLSILIHHLIREKGE
jgi:hypothetical protein